MSRESRRTKTAHDVWGLAALEGMLFTELPTPSSFEAALKPITEDAVAEAVVCGPDAGRYIEKIKKAERSGYTHVCLHQVGPQQEEFIDFCEREVLAAFMDRAANRTQARVGPRTPGRRTRRGREPLRVAPAAR